MTEETRMEEITTDRKSKRPPDLGKRLADMTRRGLSQYDMAHELNVSRMTVRHWLYEHGYQLHCTYLRVPRR